MSSRIHLVRHGIAGDAPAGMSDADRTLTPQGKHRMARIARGLRRLGVSPDIILTSPLKRAEETAELLAAGLASDAKVVVYPALAPGNAPADVVSGLRTYRGKKSIMLVGHEPDLGRLGSHLLTASPTLVMMPLKKGGVVSFEVATVPPRAHATLLWSLTPKQLRLMARHHRH